MFFCALRNFTKIREFTIVLACCIVRSAVLNIQWNRCWMIMIALPIGHVLDVERYSASLNVTQRHVSSNKTIHLRDDMDFLGYLYFRNVSLFTIWSTIFRKMLSWATTVNQGLGSLYARCSAQIYNAIRAIHVVKFCSRKVSRSKQRLLSNLTAKEM